MTYTGKSKLNEECLAKIKFVEDTWIECCVGFDEEEEPIYEEELIKEDDVLEVDVLAASGLPMDKDELVQLQFGNGEVSFVYKEQIEVIEVIN